MVVTSVLGLMLGIMIVDCQNIHSGSNLVEKCPIYNEEELEHLVNSAARKVIISHTNTMESQLANYRTEMNDLKKELREKVEENYLEITFLKEKVQEQQHLIKQLQNNVQAQAVSLGGVRLVNGSSWRDGRVEVYKDGSWGTVCDDVWGVKDANVLCKQLFGLAGSPHHQAYFGAGTGSILMDDVSCAGTETSLKSCTHVSNHNCLHKEDAGVVCMKAPPIRLSRGQSEFQGRVEVYVNNEWGTICDDGWGQDEARVICRTLGYSEYGVAVSNGLFGEGSGPIVLDDVHCRGDENSVVDCSYSSVHNCNHGEDAGAICRLPNSHIRLSNGSSAADGRIEVLINGTWGAVCYPNRDYSVVNVVCRQLGYQGGIPTPSDVFGGINGQTWLHRIRCTGQEASLLDCPLSVTGSSNCYFNEQAGAICYEETKDNIRLLNGTSSSEGLIEVLINGKWQAVCDNDWAYNGATVVCRQLGYHGNTSISTSSTVFGEISEQIWLDVRCTGSETSLLECQLSETASGTCKRQAGVICYNAAKEGLKLADGNSAHEGRVEMFINGIWREFCTGSWSDKEAKVFCRSLGNSGHGFVLDSGPRGNSGQLLMAGAHCTGMESSITLCHFVIETHGCNTTGAVTVGCYTDTSRFIRLVNGTSVNEGRVEVLVNGEWGTVCDDSWDPEDAAVVCGSLGYTGNAIPLNNAFFGPGSGRTWLDNVGCSGTETSVFDCKHNGYGIENCSHNEDAGVRCT
ncbi:deleted in malignant brain tumors 1 protein-like [Ostrea edulis]|uniref:deleted in malignant brain tumors 1 protein-like n=1 Tax=Ostrea edulis TaxID=37623 RepID=UPI0024AED6CA|nr:deleted in malignant brain tumors 1 protein-like [Ostrea edulis]